MVMQGGGGRGAATAGGIVALVSLPLSIAALVLFILYWVRIYGYSTQLQADQGRSRARLEDEDDDEDDVDDEPRRPTRPSRPDDRIR